MKSRRPYLIRAMHEWMTDNAHTPHIVVDASVPGVQVPEGHVSDGKIVLNISHGAAEKLSLGTDEISFDARFDGHVFHVILPPDAVLGIYARETGRGMLFDDEDRTPSPSGDAPTGTGRPQLKVVK
ncbi:MAG: ClpXP protease specificity-enhancing factor [Gammaproteobacteria bacterium]